MIEVVGDVIRIRHANKIRCVTRVTSTAGVDIAGGMAIDAGDSGMRATQDKPGRGMIESRWLPRRC